ncbi:MAG: DNA mismatch repair endonuclease MutL [Candidatus Kapabacteria bacterium]|nr:DNA mismatch repair endonuclease MutL [Candidatus Kapabacteria bacterium]
MDTPLSSTTVGGIFVTMPGSIQILPEHIANQIAAGEVVQRPESVVKELVENSIDAGAGCVTVVVQGAGKSLIHIIDDGAGMSRPDLELCLVRHATSKIRTEEDLHRIGTLGFRGEAMASIAAVADVEVRTRHRAEELGWTLTSHPGKPLAIAPATNDIGTQILVRQLFGSVPGRRKFLKSDMTEFRYISETMQTLALSRPNVRFVFYDGPTRVFDLAPADLRTRIAEVLTVDPIRSLIEVSASDSGISLSGYVSPPEVSRQNRSGQFLFLNGRPIKSRALSHAVNQAYEHLVSDRQFPLFSLYLDIDPERVDVNVHPQKHEVKFEDERAVFLLLQDAVMRALARVNIIPPIMSNVPIASSPLRTLGSEPMSGGLMVNRMTGEILQSGGGFSDRNYQPAQPTRFTAAHQRSHDMLFAPSEVPQETISVLHATAERIICVIPAGVMIVRPTFASERIFFEQIMAKSAGDLSPQTLMFPVEIPLDAHRRAQIEEHRQTIMDSGFEFDLGESSMTILAVPSIIAPGEEHLVIDELISAMTDVENAPSIDRHEALVAQLARQYARRSVVGMTPERAQMVVRQLRECNITHHTPFGQPTFTVIPFDEIDARFS